MLLILPHWAFKNWCYSLYQIRGNTSGPNNPGIIFTLRPSAEGVFETSLQLPRPLRLSHQAGERVQDWESHATCWIVRTLQRKTPGSDFQLLRAQFICTSSLDIHPSESFQRCQSFTWKLCFSFFFFSFSSFSSKSSLHNETGKAFGCSGLLINIYVCVCVVYIVFFNVKIVKNGLRVCVTRWQSWTAARGKLSKQNVL